MTEHVVVALVVENPTTLQSRSKIFPSDIETATAEVLPAQTPLTTSTQAWSSSFGWWVLLQVSSWKRLLGGCWGLCITKFHKVALDCQKLRI